MKTIVDIDKGVILLGREKLKEIIKGLNGQYLITLTELSPKSKDDWRKLYFLLRDVLYEDGETGYTRQQLHDLAKKSLLPSLADDNENFVEEVEAVQESDPLQWCSTRWLSEQGWSKFVKAFKEWSFENFNCYL